MRGELICTRRGIGGEPAGHRGCDNPTTGGYTRTPLHVYCPFWTTFAGALASPTRAAWSTLDALRTTSLNAVLCSSIQRTLPAPTPDASRCDSIRDNEIPSCLLRRGDRSGYVWRRSSSSWCLSL